MEYCIRYIDLPYSVKGMTVLDKNGFANIYINARLCYNIQQQAIKHELEHIRRKDFDRPLVPLGAIENI